MTQLPCDTGTCSLCTIKGDDITFLTHDVFVVCLEWLYQTPCSYVGYLGVSTLRTFKDQHCFTNFIIDFEDYRRPLHTMRPSRSYWVSSDTGHHRLEASLRSAYLQSLLEVGPARLLVDMLGDLGVSTLCSIKTRT
jgi:hypothetical protein